MHYVMKEEVARVDDASKFHILTYDDEIRSHFDNIGIILENAPISDTS